MGVPFNLNRLWLLFKHSFREWNDENDTFLAAALSYYAVFCIIPSITLLISLGSYFVESRAVEQEILRQVSTFFSVGAASSLETFIDSAKASNPAAVSVLSVMLLFYLGSRVFIQVQNTLNILWKVRNRRGRIRGLIRKRLLSFGMLVGLGLLLLVFFAFNGLIQFADRKIPDFLPHSPRLLMWTLLSEGLSIGIFSVFFAAVYRYLPDFDIKWSDVRLGALLTAVVFSVGRYLFALYFGSNNVLSAYGAAGSAIVLLAWIYFSALIFLFGAKFTYIYALREGSLSGSTQQRAQPSSLSEKKESHPV